MASNGTAVFITHCFAWMQSPSFGATRTVDPGGFERARRFREVPEEKQQAAEWIRSVGQYEMNWL